MEKKLTRDLLSSTTCERKEDLIDYEEKKKDLINDIKKLVGKESEGKRCKNVAFIGTTGVGKSSLINTIAAAFSKSNWRQYALPGHYSNSSQVTLYTESFPKERYCDMEEYEDYCLPTLIDLAGFQNTKHEVTEEILRLLFYGRITDDTSLNQLKESAVPTLRERFLLEKDNHKIDVVVFVATAHELETIPEYLISNVLKAARPCGGEKSKGKRVIPIFGVLTNVDKTDESDSTFMERERNYMKTLGIDRTRYLRCENYCDDVDTKYDLDRTRQVSAKLDVPVLKFLTQVCDPVIKVLSTEESYDTAVSSGMDELDQTALFYKRLWQVNNIEIEKIVKSLILFLILFLITLLTSLIYSGELNRACIENEARKDENKISYLKNLCQDKTNVIFRYSSCFWFSIFITFVDISFDIFFPRLSKEIFDLLMTLILDRQG